MSAIPASWDRHTITGALALRVEEHDRDGGTSRPCLSGLRVTDLASGQIAGFRPGSWLYGFVSLPAGSRRLWIEDPSGCYVPRALAVTVGDTPSFRTTAVRPGLGCAVPRGQLALWGDVVDAAGEPAPYALIRLSTDGGLRWTTTTDATGRYLVWPRGMPASDPEDGDLPFTLTLRGRTPRTADPSDLLPDDLDALDDDGLSAWFDRATPPLTLTAPQGARTRLSTLVLT